jgi:hypothetical protein
LAGFVARTVPAVPVPGRQTRENGYPSRHTLTW